MATWCLVDANGCRNRFFVVRKDVSFGINWACVIDVDDTLLFVLCLFLFLVVVVVFVVV